MKVTLCPNCICSVHISCPGTLETDKGHKTDQQVGVAMRELMTLRELVTNLKSLPEMLHTIVRKQYEGSKQTTVSF